MSTPFESIPGVTISARKALSTAGIKDLESLAGTNYEEVAGLPRIGARTLERLQAALVDKGMSFSGEIPETEQRTATWTTLDSAAPEATETSESPEYFIQNLDSPRRAAHSQLLLEIFNRATGQKPFVAGSSIVGYGRVHYRHATGREGITIRVGLVPERQRFHFMD
ncbi:helix-hairpin-helix domain-containing protein [Corynebacterium glutamicum]|uniref:helix-hairpin-helix domain-containing protein n=1 Tax=Corynebacterium glutamicum TaxID=1718 RepID=UPI000A42481A|nr:helix-hairpin-helix domain-containing protein [Corynebacterium glutamicum]